MAEASPALEKSNKPLEVKKARVTKFIKAELVKEQTSKEKRMLEWLESFSDRAKIGKDDVRASCKRTYVINVAADDIVMTKDTSRMFVEGY